MIIGFNIDLKENKMSLDLKMASENCNPYIDSMTLDIWGENVEIIATRAFPVHRPYGVDCARKKGMEVPFDRLDVHEAGLEIDMYEGTLIIILSVTGKTDSMPKVGRIEDVLRSVEYTLLKA